jgi:adenosine deaminase
MRQAGLLVTINTDDPAMIDMDLGREYRTLAAAQDLSLAIVADIALDGIEASWLDESEKRSMRTAFEREISPLMARTQDAAV